MVRDLQDIVSANRRRNSVSVYSPLRPVIRPSGRVANAGTASTILGGGGGPAEQPRLGTTSFGGAAPPPAAQLPGWAAALGSPGAQAMPVVGGSRLDQLLASNAARGPVEPEEPGGFWGSGPGRALGVAINNPIGRGVMTGLNALNYPRRIIQSSVQEVADAMNGGDASFDDWTQQIGDESFGFGNMVPDTGNSIIDGLIGFVGDMAMDPLTFVGGAGVWSAISGRTARAGTAATIEQLGIKVGNLSVRETSERVAQFGFSRFDDAARAELREQLPGMAGRILDRGYHFKVPLTQRFIPIPGTAPLDWAMSRGAGRVRATLSESRLGGWMRHATNPDGMRDAVTTLITRKPTGGLSYAGAAERVAFYNGKKLASRAFTRRASDLADAAVKEVGGGNGGRQALSDMYRLEAAGGTRLHKVFADMREIIQDKFGVHVPEFDGPYLPHYRTDRGYAWTQEGSDAANDFNRFLYKETDLNRPAAASQTRGWRPGSKIEIAGQEFTLVDGSADEINRIFHKAVPDADFDLIDTDGVSVIHRYIKDWEESVGNMGGVKATLGSKTGLVHTLGDDSFADIITADDIDALASRATAGPLKILKDQSSNSVRTMRRDNKRGINEIGGSFGVEIRDSINSMHTVSKTRKAELDSLTEQVVALEELVGVSKHAIGGQPNRVAASRGKLVQEFNKEYGSLAKQYRVLEKRHAQLKIDAAAEARRIEANGGVGATPIQDELRRVAAQQGVTGIDMTRAETILERLELNQAAQDVVNTRLGDQDFINLAVTDNLSPKSPGTPTATRQAQPPPYTGPAPAEISSNFNAQRTNLLGADDPHVAEVSARFEAINKRLDRSRRNEWESRITFTPEIERTRQALVDGYTHRAGLQHEIDMIRGRPGELQRHVELARSIDDFDAGELPRLQAEYDQAKRPVDAAVRTRKVDEKALQEVRDEQMQLARSLDARSRETPSLPMTPAQEAAVKTQRRALVRDRNKWLRTPEGVIYSKAAKGHGAATKTLESTSKQIDDITSKGGRFFIDESGAVQPKFTTKEQWALDLIEERRSTLIPARDAAEARYNAANETRARLERQGIDLWGASSEAKAAQREMSAAFKAWKQAQYAVRDANNKLTKIRDIPDLGRITAQTDELNQLLAKQASQKARVDQLAQEMATSGGTFRGFEDGIAAIDSQVAAQQAARQAIVDAPATPFGAQVAASHRAEQQRLDAIEATYAGYRTSWDDPVEGLPRPSNLGRFEGQWENEPVIRDALDMIGRVDGRRRLFDEMDEAVDIANSAAAIRASAEPFTVPPVGTPAHAAVFGYSPSSRGGAMGAVDRGQAVAQETRHVLDRHIPELVESGAVPAEFGDELGRRAADVERALDLHAANPTAHVRADLEQQASDLGRLTGFALRYKAALEGGNEASPALASFVLARHLDEEVASLTGQIGIGNARLADQAAGAAELTSSHRLAQLNERASHLTDQIEREVAKARAGGVWDKASVDRWTRELGGVQQRLDVLRPSNNGFLDDTVDSHVAYLIDDQLSVDDAEAIYNEGRFVDHRMQWPVRRRDELAASIPHREAQVLQAKETQKRLEQAVGRARANGSTTVRYTPYTSEGYKGRVAEMPLAQAEQNLVNNQQVIRQLEGDLVNKQTQMAVLEGTAHHRRTLIQRELGDVDTPPNPGTLAAENNVIRQGAEIEQRALTPAEMETIASNQARIERLNRGDLPGRLINELREEEAVLGKAIDDFGRVMGGDAAHVAVARDAGAFLRDIAAGGKGPMSQRTSAMLADVVGPETAAAAKTWIHFLDETFAGRTTVGADELDGLLDDAVRTFGDNELLDRMRQRAVASLADDGTVSLTEMTDEFTTALIASANRQRGEAIREQMSMQAIHGSTFVDGPTGLQPRYGAVAADQPSHQLLTARLRTATLETMQRKGYDPRNAIVDEVADLRTRLGRVETMRRGIDDNDEWMDVLFTGTPTAQTRQQLRGARTALQDEQQQLLAEADVPRQARLAEQRKQLADKVAAREEPILDEMTRVQQEADHIERIYTERMAEAGMSLATGRRRLFEAQRNYDEFETHRNQLVRGLEASTTKKTPSQRATIDDLKAVNQYRRELAGAAPAPAAVTPPAGPRPFTPEEIKAGWADTHAATPAEHQAAVQIAMDTQARRAAGEDIELAWFAAHGGGTSGLGNVQLPKDMPAPPGFYHVLSDIGPNKLAKDLGIPQGLAGINIAKGSRSGLTGDQRIAKLWDLGYRDAADLGGVDPEDIIAAGRQFQGAAPPTPAAAAATDLDDIAKTEAQLVAYAEETTRIDSAQQSVDTLKATLKEVEKNPNRIAGVVKELAARDMKLMFRGIGIDNPEGYAMAVDLANSIERVIEPMRTGAFWTFIDKYTAFFKTYATSKPGFHVRNALSATFMNLVDGVRLRDMYQGARLWRQYEKDPTFWYKAGVDPNITHAFEAVFGSGAGGHYAEAGLYGDVAIAGSTTLGKLGNKTYRAMMDNKLTRWNQRMGSRVEGSARLAMALNSVYRGATPVESMRRIAKFHFDYTEMSSFDRKMRRIIPFWTFMSRNLPLQIEQMLTNPRMYVAYQNLVRNLGEPIDPYTPEYWLSAGAFTVDQHAEDRESPWYIAPDLPHLQVTEPMDALMRGEWDKAFLSDINPLFLAPAEAAVIGHKVFSQANLEGYEETTPLNPFTQLFNVIGAASPFNPTATAGSGETVVDKRWAHAARSILPPWEFAERLIDPTGKREGRTDETIYRTLGLPVRQLNEDLRETERNSQYYDRREQYETQADLARM